MQPLNAERVRLLAALPAAIERAAPLPGRFRGQLARNAAEVSKILTTERAALNPLYLSDPARCAAYLRSFFPWNVYRLCRLLPDLPLDIPDGGTVIDVGSGPLTFITALWISRPDLRKKRLRCVCVDRSEKILDAGKSILSGLVEDLAKDTHKLAGAADQKHCAISPNSWTITSVRSDTRHFHTRERADFVCAANVYNEELNRIPHNDRAGLRAAADRIGAQLEAFVKKDGAILVVEPGVPRFGEFIADLRSSLLERGFFPLAPCPHCGECPFPGGRVGAEKNKWCHFAADTSDMGDPALAPLRKLLDSCKMPKERVTMSYILAGKKRDDAPATAGSLSVRVISDAFPLNGGRLGRYGCSERGRVIIAGGAAAMEELYSGSLVLLPLPPKAVFDEKSGALALRLRSACAPLALRLVASC